MELIERAVQMAAHGLRVHPLRPRDKIPTMRDWQNARLSCIDVRCTFSDDSNIGLVLGEQNNGTQLVVIDCDGERWLEWALDRFPMPALMTRNSDTGGGHLWYRWSGRLPKKRILGVDRSEKHSNAQLLSAGAQVVAPPSIHPSGRQYRWLVDGAAADTGAAIIALHRTPTLNAPMMCEICPPPPRPPKPPAMVALGVDLRTVDLRAAFQGSGMLRREVSAGKYAVVCPWEDGHTAPDHDTGSANTSTVIGARAEGGYWFRCLHASCESRPYTDVLQAFGVEMVRATSTRSASAGRVQRRVQIAQRRREKLREMGV
jgi:hypothetical protein